MEQVAGEGRQLIPRVPFFPNAEHWFFYNGYTHLKV